MRVLGIDYGAKRIGIALGDTDSGIASPWDVIQNDGTRSAFDRILAIVKRDAVELIVVGIPRPLQDQTHVNAQVNEVRAFIDELSVLGIQIEAVDESLSSLQAQVLMKDAGVREKRDDIAAQVILQTWLDSKR